MPNDQEMRVAEVYSDAERLLSTITITHPWRMLSHYESRSLCVTDIVCFRWFSCCLGGATCSFGASVTIRRLPCRDK